MSQFSRGKADYLELGEWNVACAECGRKFKSSMVVKNWQGLWKCPEHNEPRHPQDFVRAVPDIQTVPFSQPETDAFAAFCTPNGITAIIDYAVVDCVIIDYIAPSFDPSVTE